jgi:hypothetical protein
VTDVYHTLTIVSRWFFSSVSVGVDDIPHCVHGKYCTSKFLVASNGFVMYCIYTGVWVRAINVNMPPTFKQFVDKTWVMAD